VEASKASAELCQSLSNLFAVGDCIIDSHSCAAQTNLRIHTHVFAKKLGPCQPVFTVCSASGWFAGWRRIGVTWLILGRTRAFLVGPFLRALHHKVSPCVICGKYAVKSSEVKTGQKNYGGITPASLSTKSI
jgi:hypothetical protein